MADVVARTAPKKVKSKSKWLKRLKVISLLAFVLYPRLVAGPINARDADRKQDLSKIKNALERYYLAER